MFAQTIWMVTFTQIMIIWTPGITLQDHLNIFNFSSATRVCFFTLTLRFQSSKKATFRILIPSVLIAIYDKNVKDSCFYAPSLATSLKVTI